MLWVYCNISHCRQLPIQSYTHSHTHHSKPTFALCSSFPLAPAGKSYASHTGDHWLTKCFQFAGNVRPAVEGAKACMQVRDTRYPSTFWPTEMWNFPDPPGISEDCLYLNVFAPEGAKDLSVMVCIIQEPRGNADVCFWLKN